MKTQLVYLEDSYIKELDAKITDIREGVILDRTIFYAASGGQPSDSGIIRGKSDYTVTDVVKFDEIVHKVTGEPEIGEDVTLFIDWQKRYSRMRLHTAIHVVSAVAMKEFKARITGNQIYDQNARIDFNFAEWNSEISGSIAKRVNEELTRNQPVTHQLMKRDDILSMENSLKVDEKLLPDLDILRVVKIGDIDIQPDGGTHVRNTSEVGTINIYKIENKGKNNKRMYFSLQG